MKMQLLWIISAMPVTFSKFMELAIIGRRRVEVSWLKAKNNNLVTKFPKSCTYSVERKGRRQFQTAASAYFPFTTSEGLRGRNKARLPVIWRENKKSSDTQALFEDWLRSYFRRADEYHGKQEFVSFKTLLASGNVPDHWTGLNVQCQDKAVAFSLPDTTTPWLQAKDWGF
jgi:hypothetical protein